MKKQHIYYLVAEIVVLGFIFYWLQLRPTYIRKECYRYVENKEYISKSPYDSFVPGSIADRYIGFNEGEYEKCLLKHGLEK